MKKILLLSTVLFTLIFTTWCNNKESIDYSYLNDPEIRIQANQNDNHTVSFLIETNIPLPIEAMASLDLKWQSDDDTYIGSSKRIEIKKTPFEFTIDLTEDELPNGEYVANINFYPVWWAKNELAKKIENEISAAQDIIISNWYWTPQERKELKDNQLWVMENLWAGTERNINTVKSKIWNYEEIDVIKNPIVVQAFYFPKADVTIFVSKPKKNIITYKFWKENSF